MHEKLTSEAANFGSEKTGFTDDGPMDGRPTEARMTIVALLCSSTKQS